MVNKTVNISKEYTELLSKIGSKFKQSQLKAATKVNEQMLEFYFWLGSEIHHLRETVDERNVLYQRLSKNLVALFPEVKSFSVTNLKYMQYFYELYSSPQLVESEAEQYSPQAVDYL